MIEKTFRFILKALPVLGALLLGAAVVLAVRGGEMGRLPSILTGAGFLMLLAMFIKLESGRIGWYVRLLVIASLMFGNLAFIYLLVDNHPLSWDLTSGERMSLAPQTKDVLHKLQKKVEVTVYATKNEPFASYLDRFVKESERLTYRIENPYTKAEEEKAPGDQTDSNCRIVVRCGDKQEPSINLDKDIEKDALERLDRTRKLERLLVNAIVKVTQERKIHVYLTTGHGEKALETLASSNQGSTHSIFEFAKMLHEQGMNVETLDLRNESAVPDDCDTLIIAGPVVDFQENEMQALRTHLEKGRSLFALLDPPLTERPHLTRLRALLQEYGINVSDQVLADCGSYAADQSYFVPLVRGDGFNPIHPVTENLNALNENMTMPLAAAIKHDPKGPAGIAIMDLVYSSDKSWEISQAQYQQIIREQLRSIPQSSAFAKFPLAVAVYPDQDVLKKNPNMRPCPRMVVIGDSDFLSTAQLGRIQKSFGLFSVLWLTQQSDLISIPVRDVAATSLILTPQQRNMVFVFTVVLLPLIIFLGGLAYTTIRRRTR
ncbi:TPA: hypothetical protein DDW35_00185 [Candidatus Sumerlaeota bacterium]|nr:hypothetical protein [Candidatus Sumerlaeota bacterium]